jgi:hypothetical protein
MPHLTAEDRGFFKDNGYLIKRDVLSVDQIARAQDALWEGIEADRKDPSSWIGAGPRSPASASNADIRATLHDAPVFDMAEELVGRDTLNPGAAPGPALVYPSGDDRGALPERGHLDGYYTPTNGVPEGTVGLFHVGATIYVDEVAPGGAGFTLWPGTHIQAWEYFRTHSCLSIVGGSSRGAFQLPEAVEVTGPPGTVCLWHGQMIHSGSKNYTGRIRMALIARLSRKDLNDIRFETTRDMWHYWAGIN